MDKFYHVKGDKKQYTLLAVKYRYAVAKKYIGLSTTDQATPEIAFALVTSPGNSLELYIDARVENHSNQSTHPSFNGFFRSNPAHNYHKGEMSYLGTNIHEASSNPFMFMEAVLMNNISTLPVCPTMSFLELQMISSAMMYLLRIVRRTTRGSKMAPARSI